MKQKSNIRDLLNLSYLSLTNKTVCDGKLDLPRILCKIRTAPDYIALYTCPSDYQKTKNTCVAFYNYDKAFDGINGLYNAIYYNNEKRIMFFKERFKNVRLFISPDYSVCGDIQVYENQYRIAKSRIVSLWLALECKAIVIPNISFSNQRDFSYMLDGLSDVSTVACSTKGKIRSEPDKRLLVEGVRYTVDHLKNMNMMVVYDVCNDHEEAAELFAYASERGIQLVFPDNMLNYRNRTKRVSAR